MKPTDLSALLRELRSSRLPVYIGGPPGVGKSALVAQAVTPGEDFYDFRALLHDPSDLKFPVVVSGRNGDAPAVRWVQSCFPTDPEWRGVILLDELPAAPPLMQVALFQLVQTRRIGEYRLPDGAWIVAAGNRQADKSGAGVLLPPLRSRFACVELDVHAEDWLAWATTAGVSPDIRAYIRFRPGMLLDFDPARAGPFACPRTWDLLSKGLATVSDGLAPHIVRALVGGAAGTDFLAFRQIYRDLPSVDDVLAAPETHPLPGPSALAVGWALTEALADRMRGGSAAALRAGMIVAARLPAEFSVILMLAVGRLENTSLFVAGAPLHDEWSRACARPEFNKMFAR